VGPRFILHPLKNNLFASAENRTKITRLSSRPTIQILLSLVHHTYSSIAWKLLSATRPVCFNLVDAAQGLMVYEAM
jgi:hypothetical protein